MSKPVKIAGHAFIAYVREDSHRVDRLQRRLEASGVPVWRDTADLWPGEDWRAKVRQAILSQALVFIACFSANSVTRSRSYQNEELVLAIEQLRVRRPDVPWLIPVRFDDCDIPDFDLGGGRSLASLQRVDLFGDEFEDGIARVVAATVRILEKHGHNAKSTNMTDRHPRRSRPRFPTLLGRRRPAFPDTSPAFPDTSKEAIRRPSHGSGTSSAEEIRVLVIAAESDSGFATDLLDSLQGLRAEAGLFTIDLHLVTEPADGASAEIDSRIRAAHIVLLVVSRNLLAMEYGSSQAIRLVLRRHDSRQAVVFPVIYRAVSWEHQSFGRLIALPTNGLAVTSWASRDEALKDIIGSVRTAIENFGHTQLGPPDTRSQRRSNEHKGWELGEVFKPSGVPVLTFVEPDDFIEFRMALRQPGLGIVLEGPSGIGKTTILRHAVNQDAHRLGSVHILSARRSADVKQIAALPDGHSGLIAVDDFHRLPNPIQDSLADYLKRLADDDASAAKLVVVGIPDTAKGLVAMGTDLATRIRVFRPGRAADGLVLQMIEKGEVALNAAFDRKAEVVLASVGSLLTAQMLCWHLAMMAGVEQTQATTASIPTEIGQARARVAESLRLKYQPMVDQFIILDELNESLCIDLLLHLAHKPDGILRLEAMLDDQPNLQDAIERVFVNGLTGGFTSRHERISEHLYYDPRGRRLIADDPQFIFYMRQLSRDGLLEAAGKRLPVHRDQVFVCYSHKDADWLDRLEVNLKPLVRAGTIDLWSDRRLQMGDQWRKEIEIALARAQVALLLVSADFLASDFIQEVELAELLDAAKRGGCRIVPILIRPSLFIDTPDLSRFQHANPGSVTLSEMRPEEADRVLIDVARSLKDHLR